ncbi:MAG: hypothetical protein JXA18_17145 [Chitinispirillaceae bacterium]|nr:hypothetical protein [Chitinispirillaceae bacterium]
MTDEKRTSLAVVVVTTLVCFSHVTAGIRLKTLDNNLQLSIDGEAWVESGQFVKYFNADVELDHTWINRTFMHLTLAARYKERLKITMGTEGRMWFNVPKQRGTGQATYVHRQNSGFIISDANASYLFGDIETPGLSLTAGLFPYKYNRQARNLGEYLFRSGTYPAYLENKFDLAYARLTGFKISSDLFGMLHQDLIYSIETAIPPFFDGSVSYLASVDLKGFADFGAGVSFANLVSVDERVTTQENELNNRFITADGDTGYYTFRGVKLMGRACIDPKRFLFLVDGMPKNLFGREDLKIYGEALILGLKNYPRNDSANMLGATTPGKNAWGYDTLINKVVIVGGINLPMFGILDVCAVELEWYGATYPNSYKNRLGPGPKRSYAVPDYSSRASVDYTADNYKWSIYLKKTFFREHLGLVVQFARDHIRNETLVDESFDYEEALSKPDHWWWMMKLFAQF